MKRLTQALVFAAIALTGEAATAQLPGAPERLRAMVGLYRLPNGDPAIVWEIAKRQPAIGFASGELRGLEPVADAFGFGPAIGVFSPRVGSVRFDAPTNGRATALELRREGLPAETAQRVLFPEEAISFAGAGVRLAGTLILPLGPGQHAAVVLLHGSEAEDREGSRALGYMFADQGVAALIFDRRSTGQSSGSNHIASFADLAADALGAVGALQRHAGIRADRIGLFGPSQGANVALAATTKSPDIAFLILQSGDATTPLEQEMYRGEQTLRRAGLLGETETAALLEFRRRKFLFAITGKDRGGFERAVAEDVGQKELPLLRRLVPGYLDTLRVWMSQRAR